MPDHKSLVMKQQNKAGIVQKTSPPQSLTQILKVVSSKIELLESQILRDVQTDIPLLNNVAEHILSSGGKRLRPALVLLGAEMFGGIDKTELESVVGLRGFPVFGTFIISKTNKKVLETVRAMMIETDSCVTGVTQIEDIIIVRSLAKKTYLVQDLFKKIWQTVRPLVFEREASIPRIWAT